MTAMKARAIKMIQHIPEENMYYVVNILENLQAMSVNKEKEREMAKAALEDILNMERRLPDDFDMKKEIAESREERYGNIVLDVLLKREPHRTNAEIIL